jgi:hypothetical protein
MPDNDCKQRLDQNQELLDRLVAWLFWEAAQRTLQRSWGEQVLRIVWQDGVATTGFAQPIYAVKPASNQGELPGEFAKTT